jgi:hypothetical protein
VHAVAKWQLDGIKGRMAYGSWAQTALARCAMVALLVASEGCATVTGSAIATGSDARPLAENVAVRLSALSEPAGAKQVGIVQSHGTGDFEDLAVEFTAQVRKVGGNYGKIDSIRTKFEVHYVTQTRTYSCGTPQSPSTCTSTTTVPETVATTQLMGRAFLLEGK